MDTTNSAQRLLPSEEKPWLKFFSQEDLNTPLPILSMYEYLRTTAETHREAYALNYYGRRYTYAELFSEIDRVARAFSAWGVQKGEVVSFVSVAVPETIFSIYALNRLGAIANLIDPRMGVEFIQQMIDGAASRYVVCVDAAFPKVRATLEARAQTVFIQPVTRSLPLFKRLAAMCVRRPAVSYNKTVLSWNDFLAGGEGCAIPSVAVDGDAVAAIAYTGGTTGVPKGVMFTNNSVNAVAFNFKYAGFKQERKDRFLGMIPVFTSYGLVCGMHMPLCMGLELIPVPRFIPEQFGRLVRRFRPNHMISTPAFYEMLMNSREVKGRDLSFLVTLGVGGDTVNSGLEGQYERFSRAHGIRYPLAQGYGLSEMSAAVTFSINDIYKSGSVGIPSITTTVGIFDVQTGEELSYGEVGEVCMTGPSMMRAYYNQDGESAQVMRPHPDGKVWIHSGDLGYMDEDGFLFISGRVKRMITRFDGHKVFPVSIEGVIASDERVNSCSVIGIKDRGHGQGELPLALATIKPGEDSASVCEALLRECRERLDERGQPVAVLPVDALPLTGMGKVDYRALEAQYKEYDYMHGCAKA